MSAAPSRRSVARCPQTSGVINRQSVSFFFKYRMQYRKVFPSCPLTLFLTRGSTKFSNSFQKNFPHELNFRCCRKLYFCLDTARSRTLAYAHCCTRGFSGGLLTFVHICGLAGNCFHCMRHDLAPHPLTIKASRSCLHREPVSRRCFLVFVVAVQVPGVELLLRFRRNRSIRKGCCT